MSQIVKAIALIMDVYSWFNQIADPKVAYGRGDLEKYFTRDFTMQVNDNVVLEGYDNLFEYLSSFRKENKILHIHLPLEEIIISSDFRKCVARYNLTITLPSKNVEIFNVIAILHISNDHRLDRMNEVVHVRKNVENKRLRAH